jgi:hypothetical protein
MLGIIVIGKAETVIRIEPAVIGVPAFFAASDFDHFFILPKSAE